MKQVEYRKNIPPAQNVNVKWESDLQFRPHLISTKAQIPFFVFFLSLVFRTAILDFCGGFRWQLFPDFRSPSPASRSPFPAPRSPFPVLVTSTGESFTSRVAEVADKGCRPSDRVSSSISTRETGQVKWSHRSWEDRYRASSLVSFLFSWPLYWSPRSSPKEIESYS